MTLEQAVEARLNLAAEGRKLAVTNGCFDLLHRGHAEYLMQARSLADALFVLINSDESVRALKGPTRPVQDEKTRALVLAGLELVDAVTLFGEAPSGAGEITVHEGKFHQIKRMFEAVGSRITALSRVRFGPLTLDGTLSPGAWRPLTEAEIAALRQAGGVGAPEEEAGENEDE